MQLSPYGLLLLTQPLQSSEQHIRANLEFPSNFAFTFMFEVILSSSSAVDSFSNPEVLAVLAKLREAEIRLHAFSEPPILGMLWHTPAIYTPLSLKKPW